MAFEFETVAVFACGYREQAPPDPENIKLNDPNGLLYREGDFGHDYCLLSQQCPGCGNEKHDSTYPYADKGFRIIIHK